MSLGEDAIVCAECAMENENRKFYTWGPKGGDPEATEVMGELWVWLEDGSFLVKQEDGTEHKYIYPYCLCHELEDTICPCCLNDSYAPEEPEEVQPHRKVIGMRRLRESLAHKGKHRLSGFK